MALQAVTRKDFHGTEAGSLVFSSFPLWGQILAKINTSASEYTVQLEEQMRFSHPWPVS
jgi:hypothetical protein